jgi:hypothetical protein
MTLGPCVFAVYEHVFAQTADVITRDNAEEKKQFAANVEVLFGPVGIAARFAMRDVEFGRPARSMSEVCCAFCVELCELHPRYGATTLTNKKP